MTDDGTSGFRVQITPNDVAAIIVYAKTLSRNNNPVETATLFRAAAEVLLGWCEDTEERRKIDAQINMLARALSTRILGQSIEHTGPVN